jgi:hypothetical protein
MILKSRLFAPNALLVALLQLINKNVELAQRLSQVVMRATPKLLLKMLSSVLNALLVALLQLIKKNVELAAKPF